MIKIRFSKLPSHRVFDYTPLYYSKEREERDLRIESIRREKGEELRSELSFEERIRQGFQSKRSGSRRSDQRFKGAYALRMTLIIGVLTYLVVKLWDTNFIETILGL